MDTIYDLLKLRLLISSDVMKSRLESLIQATITMLEDEKGINADLNNAVIINFIVEYAAWMFERKSGDGSMPRHLQLQLHNLYLHNRKV